ncbi:MAG: universal stress protein [Gammaproteobacteria bacterium]|nr:universal stress protein [Gammaproteobacteria bacterium]MBL6998282.1 universal stress protein [Gammaproteobacteria bacterium]
MYKDILLPVDLNHESSWRSALPVALAHCKAFGARLHVMTVIPEFGMSIVGNYFPEGFEKRHLEDTGKLLHEFVTRRIPADCKVQHIVAEGKAYREIIAMAEKVNADLIIMGSHRPEMKDYLLGPNAERVVRHFSRSVLVVRDELPNDEML